MLSIDSRYTQDLMPSELIVNYVVKEAKERTSSALEVLFHEQSVEDYQLACII